VTLLRVARGRSRIGDGGFALLGAVIVVAGLLAVVFVMTALAFLDVTVSKEDETRRKLANLVVAIAGIPEGQPGATQGTHGFIGDIGRLPKSLDELNSLAGPDTLCDAAFNPASPPAFHTADGATNHRGKIGMGWRGPYFKEMVFTDEHLRDAWGQRIQYTCPESTRTEAGVSLTLRTGLLTSAGKDGLFGTADDIKSEEFYDRSHFFLTVTQGGADNAANNVTVTLYYADNGEQTSETAAPATVSGPEGTETTIVFASKPAGIRFAQIDFGGSKTELYYTFLKSNIANRINVKVPVGSGGKP
jgi:hypothetical protein